MSRNDTLLNSLEIAKCFWEDQVLKGTEGAEVSLGAVLGLIEELEA